MLPETAADVEIQKSNIAKAIALKTSQQLKSYILNATVVSQSVTKENVRLSKRLSRGKSEAMPKLRAAINNFIRESIKVVRRDTIRRESVRR